MHTYARSWHTNSVTHRACRACPEARRDKDLKQWQIMPWHALAYGLPLCQFQNRYSTWPYLPCPLQNLLCSVLPVFPGCVLFLRLPALCLLGSHAEIGRLSSTQCVASRGVAVVCNLFSVLLLISTTTYSSSIHLHSDQQCSANSAVHKAASGAFMATILPFLLTRARPTTAIWTLQ